MLDADVRSWDSGDEATVSGDCGVLELVVARRAGGEVRQLVREGVTIGRSAACDLVIEGVGVNLIHARVACGESGHWQLMGVGRGRVVLCDEPMGMMYSAERVELRIGMKFSIGEVEVGVVRGVRRFSDQLECVERTGQVEGVVEAGEVIGQSDDIPIAKLAPVELLGAVLLLCPRCYRDLNGMPVVARFCPKCGWALPERDARGVLEPPEADSPLFGVYQALREDLAAKLAEAELSEDQAGAGAGTGAGESRAMRSVIVLAYASALLKLGWRYEHGRGILRNIEEAARCYAKAGRLREVWGKHGKT